ncbi:MAG: glycoside hydrolase family 3 C-terminal domain-containing protein [Xanthomonadales bacterium]|nr:glycoside hydrolase family 3 C-terminal domain-containing protein [Xanthomonadales bacterium]
MSKSESVTGCGRGARPRVIGPVLAATLCLGASACAGTPGADPVAASAAQAGSQAQIDPQSWPALASPMPVDDAIETRIAGLLRSMSVADKVGQLVQADIGSITPEQAAQYRLGSVLAGGNSAPDGKAYATAEEWLALADAYHAALAVPGESGVAIPLLFGIDAVHGHNNVIGATLFPHNIGLGAGRNPDLVGRIAEATAREIRATGMEWTFAPTLAVPRDLRWGRTYEGYGQDPALVASFAAAVVEGLQGALGAEDFLAGHRVLAGAKHFLGDGGTVDGKDQGDARLDERTLVAVHGAGYPPALAAGVQTVMASFSSWNGEKIHGHHGLLTTALRERMGFDGFVVGDWNGHGQVPGCSNVDCPQSLIAGLDMYMAPDSWQGLFENLLAQAKSGAIPPARLDEAVARILRVKLRLGLFEAPAPSQRPLGGRFDLIGHADHRALARQAVRESLVMLKNAGGLLPLSPGQRILVAGDGADDIARQSGGWTLTWQGTGTRRADFPGATSIWEGIRADVEAAGGRAELAPDGRHAERPDVAIVVIGEEPYAEFQGDLATLAYRPGDDRDLALIRRLRAEGIPVVTVFLSGRPLWLNREINASDAFVAAWLPGSEGAGIADVLLRGADGGIRHPLRGRLSFAWPRTPTPVFDGPGGLDADPLFPIGHGLGFDDDGDLPILDESSELVAPGAEAGIFVVRGAPVPGWRWQVGGGESWTALGTDDASAGVGAQRTDHAAQEDALRLTWHDAGAVLALQGDQPVDLRRETNGDVDLLLTLRLDRARPARVGLGCGEACAGWLDWPAAVLPGGAWHQVAISLKCFESAGVDPGRIETMLALDAPASTVLSLSRVELGTGSGARIDCR